MSKDKKQTIIWTVVVVMLAVAMTAVTLWRPYSINDVARIDVRYHEGKRAMNAESPHYDEFEKALKRCLNSSRLSLFFKYDVQVEVSDKYISLCKEQCPFWVEFYMAEGEYERIFFMPDENADRQSLIVFATSTNSYDDAEILGFRDCNCKKLFEVVKAYISEQ